MEARFYLETEVYDNCKTTKRKMRPNRAKVAFVLMAIFFSALFPYFSFTVEAGYVSPIQPIQQVFLFQCLLCLTLFAAFVEAFATPTKWELRRKIIE